MTACNVDFRGNLCYNSNAVSRVTVKVEKNHTAIITPINLVIPGRYV